MTKQEKEQLEALEMYFWHEAQKASEKMLKATNTHNMEFCRGRSGAFSECEYLLKDWLETGRLELPEGTHGEAVGEAITGKQDGS